MSIFSHPKKLFLSVLAVLTLCAAGAAWGLGPELADADEDAASRNAAYREGRQALDERRWDDAVRSFATVAGEGGRDADAAVYWTAYAHFKASRHDEALETLRSFPGRFQKSRWGDDARALEREIRAASGRVDVPESGDDDEIKLLALDALMHKDSERAVDLLVKFLDGDSSQKMRERALFVLSQSPSERAREIFLEIARGRRSPELQRAAVRHLAFGRGGSAPMLAEIYRTTSDPEVKKAVLHGFGTTGKTEELMRAYREEKDPEMREAAVQGLGFAGASKELATLYGEESSVEVKAKILQAMSFAGETDFLIGVVRDKSQPQLQVRAIRALGMRGSEESLSILRDLYGQSADLDVKRAILDAFMMTKDPSFLIGLARSESEPELRRRILRNLGVNGGDAVWAFFDELWPEADASSRKAILQAYAMAGRVDRLIAIASDKSDPEMQKAAVRQLSFVESEEATEFLLSLLEE